MSWIYEKKEGGGRDLKREQRKLYKKENCAQNLRFMILVLLRNFGESRGKVEDFVIL